MSHTEGPKGQIVIAREIRDRLGVEPGWQALQRLVDDHVEIYFVPPPHTESLAGSLAPHVGASVTIGDSKEWDRAVAEAISEEFRRKALDSEAEP